MQYIKNHFNKLLQLFSLILLVIIFSACSDKKLVREINQNQAIEIVALLNQNSINASIEQATGGRSYTVLVSDTDYLRSVSLLKENSLPKVEGVTYKELISKRSLLHNSRDVDALRLDKALAIELEDTLKALPNVVDVKAVVRKKFIKDSKDQGVAVIINVTKDAQFDLVKVREIIKNTVPGISVANTSISLSKVKIKEAKNSVDNKRTNAVKRKLTPFLIWEVPQEQANQLILSTVAALLLSLIVGLIFGFNIASTKNKKDGSFDYLPDPEIMSLQFDRNNNESNNLKSLKDSNGDSDV